MRLLCGSIVAASLSATSLTAARAPEILTRSGPWIVNYDRDACHLLTQFGMGKNAFAIRFTRYTLDAWFDLALYGAKVATSEPRGGATIDFGLSPTPIKTQVVFGTAGRLAVAWLPIMRLDGWRPDTPSKTILPLTEQREAAVTGATISVAGRPPFRLEFGSLGPPMKQLRDCQRDLVKSWGYDPAVVAAHSQLVEAIVDPLEWVKPADYPAGALAEGKGGIVQVRVDVDPDGKATACHVLARTSPDVFADATCRGVLRRARFKPALDAGGKPTKSYYLQKVSWRVN